MEQLVLLPLPEVAERGEAEPRAHVLHAVPLVVGEDRAAAHGLH